MKTFGRFRLHKTDPHAIYYIDGGYQYVRLRGRLYWKAAWCGTAATTIPVYMRLARRLLGDKPFTETPLC